MGRSVQAQTAAVAFYNEMTSVLPLAGGKVVAGGSDFARLLSNGRVDTGFPFYDGGGKEDSLALQRDGRIIAGGWFTGRDGVYFRTNLSRYLPDGDTDPTFDPGLGTYGGNVYIQDVKIQQDQRIIIGGAFTHYDGHAQAYLARVLNDWPVLETKPVAGNAVELSWPAAYTNFVLQSVASITSGTWNDVPTAPWITNDICYATNTLSPGNQFFRLVKKP